MINSVVKTFQTIEFLLNEKETELARISKALGFPKSTVRRILQTLTYLGFVEQDPRSLRYRPTTKFFAWGRLMIGQVNLLDVARPLMIKLSEKTGETVNLGILDGPEVICVDKIASKQALRQDQPIGERTLAYCTAFGKAQLAFLPEEKLAALFPHESLKTCTEKSSGQRAEIMKELKVIRKAGFAQDDEEFAEGVRCVGAPIFDDASMVVAGISIAGPTFRMASDRISRLAGLAMETAELISFSLGYPQQSPQKKSESPLSRSADRKGTANV